MWVGGERGWIQELHSVISVSYGDLHVCSMKHPDAFFFFLESIPRITETTPVIAHCCTSDYNQT